MEASQIRKELHQFIENADEQILNMMHSMIKIAEGETENQISEEPHEKLLEDRLRINKSPFEQDLTK